jgi:NADH-quinone oxidoreductase subunit I
MYGVGLWKGLQVTFKHFVNTYVNDLRLAGKKLLGQSFEQRQGLQAEGIFTVEYPDEKLAVPERFRFVPFLVVEDADHPERPGHDWCTSCGICAKVCPPQCIWIVRGQDPTTGRPVPEPDAFFIDIDICMNCGFCAEFCPFDAIKMDHDYEMASYDRTSAHIHDKKHLSKPVSYWLNIAPTTALEEAKVRGGWEHPDVIKAMKKAGKTPVTPTADNARPWEKEVAQKPTPQPVAEVAPVAVAEKPATPAAAAEAPKPAAAPAATAAEGAKPKFDKAAMMAKIRERKANKGGGD